MLVEKIEQKWIDCFSESFRLSGISSNHTVAILAETQSREILVDLAELALQLIGAKPVTISVPSPKVTDVLPLRSTGSSYALREYGSIIPLLSACDLIVDCTVEGILHTRELQTIIEKDGKVLMISNEHPEILERLVPNKGISAKVIKSLEMLGNSSEMTVKSDAGTDLHVEIRDAPCRAGAGYLLEGQKVAYWPGGLALFFPLKNTVNGQVVLDVGDVNLTFKRYIETPITLLIENDYVVSIEGKGLDADMMRSYYKAWNDADAYAISHVGWGLNDKARWESMLMYDKTQINGTELRAFAGNFLISTGANEFADRFTKCHFDIPMRKCSICLDGQEIVSKGNLAGSLLNG